MQEKRAKDILENKNKNEEKKGTHIKPPLVQRMTRRYRLLLKRLQLAPMMHHARPLHLPRRLRPIPSPIPCRVRPRPRRPTPRPRSTAVILPAQGIIRRIRLARTIRCRMHRSRRAHALQRYTRRGKVAVAGAVGDCDLGRVLVCAGGGGGRGAGGA